MRALVTGTSGHVGGAIAAHLVEAGWDVFGLSRRPSRVAGLRGQVLTSLGTPEFMADARAVAAPPEVIVHAAANLDKNSLEPTISLVNGLGTQQMLALAAEWGVKHFVYISGVPVIGTPEILPITEDHPVHPLTAYHASKAYGDYLVDVVGRGGLRAASLRLTSPVGPGMPANRILSVFAARAAAGEPLTLAGRGSRRQNYVDVRDVAIAVAQCVEREATGLFNVAGAESTTNLALAEACVRVLHSASAITFSGKPDPEEGIAWDISIDRARAAFGYQPQYDIEASICAVAADVAAASVA